MASVIGATEDHRLDRWCAVALVVSAALQTAYTSGWLMRRPSGEHLIAHWWTIELVQVIVLVAVAVSYATGKHRDVAAAFLVGFSALTLFSVLFEVESGLGIWAGDYHAPGWMIWFAAASLEVGVALRALRAIIARARQQVLIPSVVTAVVVVAVLVAVGVAEPFGGSVDPITRLLLVGTLGAIPVLALRHADTAAPMLCGLAAGLMVALAGRWLAHFAIPHEFRSGYDLEVSVAIVPALVLLGALAGFVARRTSVASP